MGNQPSRSGPSTPTSSPQSPNVTSSHAPALHHDRPHAHAHAHAHVAHPNPRRRESIQALSVKASAAPPSASLESAAALTATGRPHSRARSQTAAAGSTAAAVAHTLRIAQDSLKSASEEKMGNEQSRHKGHTRDRESDPTPPRAKLAPAAIEREKPAPSPQTRPVDVPAVPREDTHGTRTEAASSIEPADASQENYIVPSSLYNRPPRLPLAIEEEIIHPGSPIISPTDLASPIDQAEIEGALPRRSSLLSSTTADDEELGEEFKDPQNQETVPTVIEWDGPGERVYVTGTFAGWNRKYKLHRNGPSGKKDALSAYVHITPGTHHLMFIVDNDMRTSDKLPTAVDYTNILVNYLEVSKDDVPRKSSPAGKKQEPTPVQDRLPPDGVYPPQILPPTPEIQPVKTPEVKPPVPEVPSSSPKKYHSSIPRFLLDLDAPEESRKFARANAVGAHLPQPPTLPLFLAKSILNGITPMKDDSSVLIMPNHTVLNHLATSSIKDNILATSATTRYKQKFLTTIMYKPRAEESDREY